MIAQLKLVGPVCFLPERIKNGNILKRLQNCTGAYDALPSGQYCISFPSIFSEQLVFQGWTKLRFLFLNLKKKRNFTTIEKISVLFHFSSLSAISRYSYTQGSVLFDLKQA